MKCPTCQTELLVIQDEPLGIVFICPVCLVERTHDQLHEKDRRDGIYEPNNDGLSGKDQI